MNIEIAKSGVTPIYKQIIAQILYLIQKGELKNGDKLTSERLLSVELQISRGTITKAYSELANMEIVTLIKGKGCFVSDEKTFLSLNRKEKAVLMIKNTINNLVELGFSISEIRIFSEIVLMEKEKNYSTIRIGIIDCNREALHAIQRQIGTIKGISISKYLLEDIYSLPLQSEIIGCDLLITTYRHYEDVLTAVKGIEEQLIRVEMSPSSKTLIEVARIGLNKNIGILYDSETFLGIMNRELKLVDIEAETLESLKIEDLDQVNISAFLKNKEILIIPPLTFFESSFRKWLMLHLENKQIIEFNYLIERGNLLYIEEKIRSLMINK